MGKIKLPTLEMKKHTKRGLKPCILSLFFFQTKKVLVVEFIKQKNSYSTYHRRKERSISYGLAQQ